MSQNHQVQFGVFEVDFRAGELRRAGARVHIQEQPFRVLEMLLEHPGEIITRSEIQQALWPDTQVGDFDHAINVAVKKLRDALGDDADDPKFVETMSRRGYRFIAPVKEAITAVQPLPEPLAPVKSIAEASAPGRLHPRRRTVALAGIVVLALLGIAYYALQYRVRAASPQITSLAVLPLANLSGDPGQEYIVDGITDELITNLGKISSLKVISRTSVMRFKNSTAPVAEIAKELKVDAILEGSVVRQGDRVRINAQLIRTDTDTHLWADTYDRDMSDLLALSSEVTRTIAEQVRTKLTLQERRELQQNRPVVKEAYDAYLQGRYFFHRRQYDKAASYFDIAVQKDPNYLAAWYSLSESRSMSSYIRGGNGIDTSPAREQVMRLAPDSAEAHILRGDERFYGSWDWTACESEFHVAVELSPRSWDALDHYAGCRAVLGEFDEAARHMERLKEMDPLSPNVWQNEGTLFHRAHQPRRAIGSFLKAIELDPRASVYHALGLAYDDEGNTAAAREAYLEALRRGDATPEERKTGEQILSRDGNAAFLQWSARATLERLERAKNVAEVSNLRLASAYVATGDKDRAFQHLEQAYKQRDPHLPFIKVSRVWDPLRSDPRFQDLLRRMKLD